MLSADNGLAVMCAVQPGGRCNGFLGTQLSCTDVHAIYGAERIRSDRIGLVWRKTPWMTCSHSAHGERAAVELGVPRSCMAQRLDAC
jgi:hypothetical protein